MSQQQPEKRRKLLLFRWLKGKRPLFSRVPQSIPRLERLVDRRLLSATVVGAEQGAGASLGGVPTTSVANGPLQAGLRNLSLSQAGRSGSESLQPKLTRQRITDSVLSLVAQSQSDKTGKRPPGISEPALTGPVPPANFRGPSESSAGSVTRKPPPFFPQGDSAPPFELSRSIPLGLFPDGSVHAIHPDIDPDVYRALQRNGKGPWEATLHHSKSLYGAPTRMAAGTDPRLLILVGMRPNWHAATGKLTYTQQSISIPEIKSSLDAASIYQQLKDFRHFDRDNLAQVRIVRAGVLDPVVLQGRQFALFRVRLLLQTQPLQTHWGLANTIQRLVNVDAVAVELHYHDRIQTIEAVTLGNHMLVGQRHWQVLRTGPNSVQVTSKAWVYPNGKLNELGMKSLGPLAMERIWTQYLTNIGNAVKCPGSPLITGPVIHYQYNVRPAVPPRQHYPWPPVPSRDPAGDHEDLLFHRPTLENGFQP